MLDVSIIIVNYNTLQITQNCIESVIEKTKGIQYEIILVDNASTDGSKELFEKDERITYIFSEKNGGFGYGNNLGMKVAKGKYFFLLNSDTLLVNNAVKEFYEYAEKDVKKRIYGSYLLYEDGKTYCTSYFYFPAFTIGSFIKRACSSTQIEIRDLKIKDVEAVSGANMFFHREIYDRTGGFDDKIFLYGEEGEWQYRMLKAGYPCRIINQPKIIHLEAKSTKTMPSKKAVQLSGHFYILKKHMLYPIYLMARIYYAINLLIRNISHLKDKDYYTYFQVLLSPIK